MGTKTFGVPFSLMLSFFKLLRISADMRCMWYDSIVSGTTDLCILAKAGPADGCYKRLRWVWHRWVIGANVAVVATCDAFVRTV